MLCLLYTPDSAYLIAHLSPRCMTILLERLMQLMMHIDNSRDSKESMTGNNILYITTNTSYLLQVQVFEEMPIMLSKSVVIHRLNKGVSIAEEGEWERKRAKIWIGRKGREGEGEGE